jgi:hypothetical protein
MRIRAFFVAIVTVSALMPAPLLANGHSAYHNAKAICHAALDAKGLTKGVHGRRAEYEKCMVDPGAYN